MKAYHRSLAAAVVLLAACNSDQLQVPNYNSPTTDAVGKDPGSIQLLAGGILAQLRGSAAGWISNSGIFGREAYNYFPTDGRGTTHYLLGPGPGLDYTGFAVGNFAGPYANGRNIYNFLGIVAGAASLSQAQKDAAAGFAKTIEALEYLMILNSRDTIGVIVEIKEDPTQLAPFVSRDSGYKYVGARLDEAAANLAAGGAAFPFTMHAGFAGFNTPANFLKFNRAIAARVYAYHASLSTGAAQTALYQKALTALAGSFITLNASQFRLGPFHVYSLASGDATNGVSNDNKDFVGHASIRPDAKLQANGLRDARLLAKVDTAGAYHAPSPNDLTLYLGTNTQFKIYPDRTAPIPIIRNEELILLRAEAQWFTGAKAAAIADLDFVRVNSGGLPPTGLTVASSDSQFLDELLYDRRYSLLVEGHRWIDVRRFGRLNTLPLDFPQHFRYRVQPIPQGECLLRVNETTPAMRGPGCP